MEQKIGEEHLALATGYGLFLIWWATYEAVVEVGIIKQKPDIKGIVDTRFIQ